VEGPIKKIYEELHLLTGFHRQLLEVVRLERTHLIDADLKAIEMITAKKQILIEQIGQTESRRLKLLAEVAVLWKKPIRDVQLQNIVIQIQSDDPKGAEQLRSIHNALTLLIQRITEQNAANRTLVEQSLEHIRQMKVNALGEAAQGSQTYTASGQKAIGTQMPRLYSGEA